MPNYSGSFTTASQLAPTFAEQLSSYLSPVTNAFSGFNNTIGFGNGGLLNNSMNYLNKYSDGLGALGGIYGAYNKQHMANKMYGLQKDAYNFNKMLSQQELDRRKKADKSLQSAWANSSYNTGA